MATVNIGQLMDAAKALRDAPPSAFFVANANNKLGRFLTEHPNSDIFAIRKEPAADDPRTWAPVCVLTSELQALVTAAIGSVGGLPAAETPSGPGLAMDSLQRVMRIPMMAARLADMVHLLTQPNPPGWMTPAGTIKAAREVLSAYWKLAGITEKPVSTIPPAVPLASRGWVQMAPTWMPGMCERLAAVVRDMLTPRGFSQMGEINRVQRTAANVLAEYDRLRGGRVGERSPKMFDLNPGAKSERLETTEAPLLWEHSPSNPIGNIHADTPDELRQKVREACGAARVELSAKDVRRQWVDIVPGDAVNHEPILNAAGQMVGQKITITKGTPISDNPPAYMAGTMNRNETARANVLRETIPDRTPAERSELNELRTKVKELTAENDRITDRNRFLADRSDTHAEEVRRTREELAQFRTYHNEYREQVRAADAEREKAAAGVEVKIGVDEQAMFRESVARLQESTAAMADALLKETKKAVATGDAEGPFLKAQAEAVKEAMHPMDATRAEMDRIAAGVVPNAPSAEVQLKNMTLLREGAVKHCRELEKALAAHKSESAATIGGLRDSLYRIQGEYAEYRKRVPNIAADGSEDERGRALMVEAVKVRGELEREIRAVLAKVPAGYQIEVREGGGPENVAATLAVTVGNLIQSIDAVRKDNDRLAGKRDEAAAKLRQDHEAAMTELRERCDRSASEAAAAYQSERDKAATYINAARRELQRIPADPSGYTRAALSKLNTVMEGKGTLPPIVDEMEHVNADLRRRNDNQYRALQHVSKCVAAAVDDLEAVSPRSGSVARAYDRLKESQAGDTTTNVPAVPVTTLYVNTHTRDGVPTVVVSEGVGQTMAEAVHVLRMGEGAKVFQLKTVPGVRLQYSDHEREGGKPAAVEATPQPSVSFDIATKIDADGVVAVRVVERSQVGSFFSSPEATHRFALGDAPASAKTLPGVTLRYVLHEYAKVVIQPTPPRPDDGNDVDALSLIERINDELDALKAAVYATGYKIVDNGGMVSLVEVDDKGTDPDPDDGDDDYDGTPLEETKATDDDIIAELRRQCESLTAANRAQGIKVNGLRVLLNFANLRTRLYNTAASWNVATDGRVVPSSLFEAARHLQQWTDTAMKQTRELGEGRMTEESRLLAIRAARDAVALLDGPGENVREYDYKLPDGFDGRL